MTQKEVFLLFPPDCCKDGLLLLLPPDRFPRLAGHVIEECRMQLLVCSGVLHLELNGEPCEMRGPALMDVMENVTVRIKEVEDGVRVWCMFVTFEFASEALKNLRPGPLNHLLERLSFPVWTLSEKECEVLEKQLVLLKETIGNIAHYYRSELAATYFRSFSLEMGNILLAHEPVPDVSTYISKQDFIVLNFMKLVAKHFREEHGVEFYADCLCISSKHLTRVIKVMTGKTPHTILCHELLHQAMTLLEDERIPVSQIAEELHFSDQAAFCKFFKKYKNMPPMTYRRRGYQDG